MRAIQQSADAAMYVAKASGRNRVSCFDELAKSSAVAELNLDSVKSK